MPSNRITEIRILPMGHEGEWGFKTKEDVNNFLLYDLKENGRYYYQNSSFANDSKDCLFVLFQYGNQLVGCAKKIDQNKDEGYYIFDIDTIQLFDSPITIENFSPLVDNKVKAFCQALHKIDVKYLDVILDYIEQSCFESDANKQSIIVSEGKKKLYYGTRYERNPRLRKVAIELNWKKHGSLVCELCQTDYTEQYNKFGISVMEVHHIKPLGEVKNEHDVNPQTDLVCLCANCHKVMHSAMRTLRRAVGVKELRDIVF